MPHWPPFMPPFVPIVFALALSAAVVADGSAADQTGGAAPTTTAVAPQPEKGRWTVFPLATFAPETSLQFSAFAIYAFANPPPRPTGTTIGSGGPPATPPPSPHSNIAMIAAYTLKNQFIVTLSPTLYLADGAWRVAGNAQALWFPDVFYEPGADSPAQSMEKFTQRAFIGSLAAERRVLGRLRVGGQAMAVTATMTEVAPGGRLAAGEVLGSDGGTAYGIGPTVSWDSRDREFNPQRGGRHMLSFGLFPRVANADFSFAQTTLDLRQYVPTPWHGQVVAFQFFTQMSRGDIPFQLMPTLGGDGRMRGFFATRFRDMHTLSTQAEYRAAIWWRLGLVVFGGVGDVGHRLADFDAGHFRATAGGGLRVALDQKEGINLSLDVGHASTGDTNLYLQLGEGF